MAVQDIAYSQDGINAGWIRRLDSNGAPTGPFLDLVGFNAANFAREVTTRTLLSNNTTYKETSKFSKYTGTLTLVALKAAMVEFFLPGELVVDGDVARFVEATDSQPTKFALYLKSDADGENGEGGAIGEFYPNCQATNFSNPKTTGEYVSFEVTITALAKDGSPRTLIFDESSEVFNTGDSGDTTPPTVSSVAASSGTFPGSVAVSADIYVNFSERIRPTSVQGIRVYKKSDGADVPLTVGYAETGGPPATVFRATLEPVSDLSAATTYVIYVPNSVRDVNGNDMAVPSFTEFTTA